MKFTKGQFIRWISKDDEGEFSHTGQVISHKNGMIIFTDAKGGEMGVPDDEGKFEVARKPRTWSVKRPAAEAKPTKAARKPARAKRSGGSKIPQVVALLREHKPASRKEAIALIVSELGMTDAGASTYYNTARKQV